MGYAISGFRVIRDVEMDEFYNLAAQSFVGASWELPIYTADVDGMAVVRILDTLREEMTIPVWHDDQQGTATVVVAALRNPASP